MAAREAYAAPMPKQPTARIARARRRGLILALCGLAAVVVAVGVGLFAVNSVSHGAPRMKPEAAVQQYMEGVAAGDAARVLQACAIDEASTRFKYDAQAERVHAIIPSSNLFHSGYAFYADMNGSAQSALVFGEVRGLEWSLLVSAPYDRTITPADATLAQQYVKDLDPSRLANLKVISVRFPSAKLLNDARTTKYMAAMAAIYGADEMTDRLALFQWNGKYYYVGFTLVRYGGD
jgi:hypothetical protein